MYPWKQSAYANRTGPYVCSCSFAAPAFKLQLDPTLPYLFRNAAEQHFAALAPTAFYGNAYSTFSKGVALYRAASSPPPSPAATSRAIDPTRRATRRATAQVPVSEDISAPDEGVSGPDVSFAYDCALPATRTWRQPGARVTLAHPGFELLRTIPGACHPR